MSDKTLQEAAKLVLGLDWKDVESQARAVFYHYVPEDDGMETVDPTKDADIIRLLNDNDPLTLAQFMSHPPTIVTDHGLIRLSRGMMDVVSERVRQQSDEGMTPELDDAYTNNELLLAALGFLSVHRNDAADGLSPDFSMPEGWPFGKRWWKPRTRRENLIRGLALGMAELDRMDRISDAADWEGAEEVDFLDEGGDEVEGDGVMIPVGGDDEDYQLPAYGTPGWVLVEILNVWGPEDNQTYRYELGEEQVDPTASTYWITEGPGVDYFMDDVEGLTVGWWVIPDVVLTYHRGDGWEIDDDVSWEYGDPRPATPEEIATLSVDTAAPGAPDDPAPATHDAKGE